MKSHYFCPVALDPFGKVASLKGLQPSAYPTGEIRRVPELWSWVISGWSIFLSPSPPTNSPIPKQLGSGFLRLPGGDSARALKLVVNGGSFYSLYPHFSNLGFPSLSWVFPLRVPPLEKRQQFEI